MISIQNPKNRKRSGDLQTTMSNMIQNLRTENIANVRTIIIKQLNDRLSKSGAKDTECYFVLCACKENPYVVPSVCV